MRRRECLPRLNRRQKTVRNLLAALGLLLVLWLVNGFAAPTLDLAVRWKAAEYFLEEPEILGVYPREISQDWKEDDVLLRDGDVFASTIRRHRFLWFQEVLEFWFAEPETGPVVFLQQRDSFDTTAVYVYAELDSDVRAVCDLQLRSDITVRISGDGQQASRHFDWDETYTMEGTPNENGLYRFAVEMKYPRDNRAGYEEQLRPMAEESAFHSFQAIPRRAAGSDFACDVTVIFYGADGKPVYVYQRTLWDKLDTERSGAS